MCPRPIDRSYRGQRAQAWADGVERAIRPVLNIVGDNETTIVSQRGNAMVVSARIDALLKQFTFGWRGRVGETKKVLINGGWYLTANGCVQVPDQEVEVGGSVADHHFILCRSPGVIEPSTVRCATFGGHEEHRGFWPLYEVYLSRGAPVRYRIAWNTIDSKTWFAAPS